jgi:hypothetical protein
MESSNHCRTRERLLAEECEDSVGLSACLRLLGLIVGAGWEPTGVGTGCEGERI